MVTTNDAQTVKNLPAVQEIWVLSLGLEDPWGREWLYTPVFLPGEFHGQRSLVGYSPCGHKELDMTELLTYTQMTEHNVGTTQPVHKLAVCEKWNIQILRMVLEGS